MASLDPAPAEEAGGWLIFTAGSNLLAVAMPRVVSIIEAGDIFPVPMVSPRILGVTYWRETALPILRPEAIAGARPKAEERSETAAPLAAVIQVESEMVGILFDRIERVVPREEIAADPGPAAALSELLEPWGRYRDRPLFRLRLERIRPSIREGEPRLERASRRKDG